MPGPWALGYMSAFARAVGTTAAQPRAQNLTVVVLPIPQPISISTIFSALNKPMFCNLNGKILNEANANISVNNRSFRYGDGCFETMKWLHGRLLLPVLHFDRLFASLETLQFDCPRFFTPEYLLQQVQALVVKNQHQKIARIRLTVFRGNGGLYDPENMKPNWLIQSWPLNPDSNTLNTNGLVVGIYHDGIKAADKFANIKSNNYLLYSQAALYAKQQHWNDALILNNHGTIADATIANLFIISNNTIITPPLTDGPVSGVMRRHLLQQLPLHGYKVLEQSIEQKDMVEAGEAFLTNGIYGLKWIKSMGNKTFDLSQAATIHKKIIAPLFAR
jgi:branched-chain amino acid aminotransferase